MADLGRICLLLALVVCAYGIFASIYGVRAGRPEFSESGRRSVYALAGILTVAMAVLEVAFLRSPVAHARLKGVTKPEGGDKRVFTLADLPGMGTIRANSALPGFRVSEQPALAKDKLRHVGELMHKWETLQDAADQPPSSDV